MKRVMDYIKPGKRVERLMFFMNNSYSLYYLVKPPISLGMSTLGMCGKQVGVEGAFGTITGGGVRFLP